MENKIKISGKMREIPIEKCEDSRRKEIENLKKELSKWMEKVINVKVKENENGFVDTYAIMKDVDEIIAYAFDRECLFCDD